MATSNPSGTTADAIFTKLPRPLAKDCKHLSVVATYVASFSMTYLATSLEFAKLSVTEHMGGTRVVKMARFFNRLTVRKKSG